MSSIIEHPGTIKEVKGHQIIIELQVKENCDECVAKSLCHLATEKSKVLSIPILKNDVYKEGDKVIVGISIGKALSSIGMGYLLPLLIVLVTFGTSTYFGLPLQLGALISFFAIIPFLVMLIYYREKLKKNFHFQVISKSSEE